MKKIDLKTYEKPSDYMHFPVGDTTIRLISSGGLAKRHGMRTAKGWIPLGECSERADCENCLKGNKAAQKWTWVCFNKKRNEVKILDVGPMIGHAICNIAQEKGVDFQDMDFIINRVGQERSTEYKVKAGEVKPLTDEEVKAIAGMKQYLIKKYLS